MGALQSRTIGKCTQLFYNPGKMVSSMVLKEEITRLCISHVSFSIFIFYNKYLAFLKPCEKNKATSSIYFRIFNIIYCAFLLKKHCFNRELFLVEQLLNPLSAGIQYVVQKKQYSVCIHAQILSCLLHNRRRSAYTADRGKSRHVLHYKKI